jgi:hypothetical protein
MALGPNLHLKRGLVWVEVAKWWPTRYAADYQNSILLLYTYDRANGTFEAHCGCVVKMMYID